MKDIQSKKVELRKSIVAEKNKFSPEQLLEMSEEVWSVLEITGVFQDAKNIFIYNSMSDEVSTQTFINRWLDNKSFYVPVVEGDSLEFRKYDGNTVFKESDFGIMEPQGENFRDYKQIDLIIVPGMAFDRRLNRMGRGKGYYDKFLPNISALKVGVCFDFQLVENVPAEVMDIQMDYIVSENDLIWK